MEFKLERVNEEYFCEYDFGAQITVREKLKFEVMHDREELIKYCKRRLEALYYEWAMTRAKVYDEIGTDLNKAFLVSDGDVVEKAAGRPAIPKRN